MLTDDEWSLITSLKNAGSGKDGSGALRIALLFGAFAVVLAVFLAPAVEKKAESIAASSSLDTMTTGAINGGKSARYTIRRSILQDSPNAACIISGAGTRSGECD